MMVQGHTIHTFLDYDLRTSDSLFYIIWHTLRGFTAPIFMFTAGVVFTYLLFLNTESHNRKRLIKGLKRFALLVSIGYLLRYPTYKIFDFSDVTQQQWQIFFGVDALHLIGFGLLFIILITVFSEKLNITPYAVLSIGMFSFFFLYPFVDNINWSELLPAPIAAYFYNATGSLFPLFPWAGYVLAGSILGLFLAHYPNIHKEKVFGLRLLIVGASLVFAYFLFAIISRSFDPMQADSIYKVNVIFLRLGVVISLNGVISIAALKLKDLPDIVKLIGRHTLVIYVVHLVILYGSAWIPGLYNTYAGTLNTINSIFAVALMYALMGGMVFFINRMNQIKRQKVTA